MRVAHIEIEQVHDGRFGLDLFGDQFDPNARELAWKLRSRSAGAATVIEQLAPDAALVVGMSMGGMTSMQLAVRHPALVRKLLLVDITPGVNAQKAKAVRHRESSSSSFVTLEDRCLRLRRRLS